MSGEGLDEGYGEFVMSIFAYKARSQFELFCEARDRYHEIVDQLKAKMRDVPLEYLIDLIEQTGNTSTKTDPDMLPEKKFTLSDAAMREIHRRAFQGFTIVPLRKKKTDGSNLGFLRKPQN